MLGASAASLISERWERGAGVGAEIRIWTELWKRAVTSLRWAAKPCDVLLMHRLAMACEDEDKCNRSLSMRSGWQGRAFSLISVSQTRGFSALLGVLDIDFEIACTADAKSSR